MLKVIRQTCETNPNYMTYKTGGTISKHGMRSLWRKTIKSPWIPTSKKEQDELFMGIEETGTQLMKKLLTIPQLVEIFIHPTELSVVKIDSSTWEEVEPQIIQAFKEVFKEEMVELFGTGIVLLKTY